MSPRKPPSLWGPLWPFYATPEILSCLAGGRLMQKLQKADEDTNLLQESALLSLFVKRVVCMCWQPWRHFRGNQAESSTKVHEKKYPNKTILHHFLHYISLHFISLLWPLSLHPISPCPVGPQQWFIPVTHRQLCWGSEQSVGYYLP